MEHLKVGLTNVIIKNDPYYFNSVINGAKVLKGENARNANTFGRSALMVQRSLGEEMLLTLTWIGQEFQLNFIAETFINSAAGV